MIISTLLFILAAIANAIQQTADLRYDQSIFMRWPKFFGEKSWENKYAKDGYGFLIEAPDNWYYKRFNIKFMEKFPFSATLLVFLTDGFHLFQGLRTSLVILAMMFFDVNVLEWSVFYFDVGYPYTVRLILVFLFYKGIYSGIFELCYSRLLLKK